MLYNCVFVSCGALSGFYMHVRCLMSKLWHGVYTVQPVVEPVLQPIRWTARCIRALKAGLREGVIIRSWLSILQDNSHRHARHDTDRTVLSCLVWRCELSRPDRRTRQDKTAARPARASRPPPPRRRQSRQLRLAARPPTRSDVVRRTKCKHAVNCCMWLNLNYFTKRHATRANYRLTLQTLPDSLESQFTPPDMTQTALSRCVWPAVWTGHKHCDIAHSFILRYAWCLLCRTKSSAHFLAHRWKQEQQLHNKDI